MLLSFDSLVGSSNRQRQETRDSEEKVVHLEVTEIKGRTSSLESTESATTAHSTIAKLSDGNDRKEKS